MHLVRRRTQQQPSTTKRTKNGQRYWHGSKKPLPARSESQVLVSRFPSPGTVIKIDLTRSVLPFIVFSSESGSCCYCGGRRSRIKKKKGKNGPVHFFALFSCPLDPMFCYLFILGLCWSFTIHGQPKWPAELQSPIGATVKENTKGSSTSSDTYTLSISEQKKEGQESNKAMNVQSETLAADTRSNLMKPKKKHGAAPFFVVCVCVCVCVCVFVGPFLIFLFLFVRTVNGCCLHATRMQQRTQ